MTPAPSLPPRRRVLEVLALAWPAIASYLLNNAYRINDQFWIQGLGADAQTAIGATMFVLIGSFSLLYLACGGTLSLVSRSLGAGDPRAAHRTIRHALLLGGGLALAISITGPFLAGPITRVLGLEGEPARLATEYLGTLFLLTLPLALAPVTDHAFIGLGSTRIPMALQAAAVLLNFLLNPVLIYGSDGAAHLAEGPAVLAALAGGAAHIAEVLGIEGRGMQGAALATGLSRVVTSAAALAILRLRFGVSLLGGRRPDRALLGRIARISAPVSLSIATYAGVYWALLGFVLSRLPATVTAGLGIGFQVFEGVAFPAYLGTSMACATLVGRRIGARDPDGALEVLRAARLVARGLGLVATVVFLVGAGVIAPRFTQDEAVLAETLIYVRLLAFSQYWVAQQVVNEKALLGAGWTRPILWITTSGDLMRIPLSYALAVGAGLGAAGVWWAINLTTYYKAGLIWWAVRRGDWLPDGRPAGATTQRPSSFAGPSTGASPPSAAESTSSGSGKTR